MTSRSHPNIGTKRRHDGGQGDEEPAEQFAHIATVQTKLAQAEKAVRNLSAPASRSEAHSAEITTDPIVYLELEKTRRKHDDLVQENAQLRQQAQPPSKQLSELMEANKKLRTDLSNLQNDHRRLEMKLQNAEGLIEIIKQDALVTKKECQVLTEENNTLSSQVFVLEHAQHLSCSQPAGPGADQEQNQHSAQELNDFLEMATSGVPDVEPDVELAVSPDHNEA